MIDTEPVIRVGLMASKGPISLKLDGDFKSPFGVVRSGGYNIERRNDRLRMTGNGAAIGISRIRLRPLEPAAGRFTIDGVTIGIDFHWQRQETQSFHGAIEAAATETGIQIVNEIPLEAYLAAVISSEMSANCPPELLRAHAIVSRSWLLSQIVAARDTAPSAPDTGERPSSSPDLEIREELIRWYGREAHTDFDVCADDHCQRYQGIGKAFSGAVFDAVRDTRGNVLCYRDEICDARYSKSCGGMTECYSAAWDEKEVPYLSPVYDGAALPSGFDFPLTAEANAERWICSSPPAYCNTNSAELLSKILPGFDQETTDFYRWEVSYDSAELAEILRFKLGIDFGDILSLRPIQRGASGRIIKLHIVGDKRSLTIGKELEIRRALSRSHLYSSAFVVRKEETGAGRRFKLIGGGWGHGVGMCQIGAAVMAGQGISHQDILSHYFKGASLKEIY